VYPHALRLGLRGKGEQTEGEERGGRAANKQLARG
jgi:hypothetical protein